MENLNIISYSEKAVVLAGDTKPIKDLLFSAGGKFNARLTHPQTRKPLMGWIFSKKRQGALETILTGNGIKYSVDAAERSDTEFLIDPAEIAADNFCQQNRI